jgi:hypothetical protein
MPLYFLVAARGRLVIWLSAEGTETTSGCVIQLAVGV